MKDYLPYFKVSELRCKCGKCDGGQMNDDFMSALNDLRTACEFPLIISSAFRCPSWNKKVGGSSTSGHLYGLAVDIKCSSSLAWYIMHHAMSMACFPAIGINQKKSRYIHIGWDNPPRIWSY